MEFTGFSPETYDFLARLAFNNNHEFFQENREVYEHSVKLPMQLLEQRLAPIVSEIDPRVRTGKMAVSRIFRDTRFTKDKAPYRDHVWIGYKPGGVRNSEFFSFYIFITPVLYGMGVGIDAGEPGFMNAFRERALKKSVEFAGITGAPELTGYEVGGEMFKRGKVPEDHPFAAWLNRKGVWLERSSREISRTMTPGFADEAIAGISALAPLYRFVHELN